MNILLKYKLAILPTALVLFFFIKSYTQNKEDKVQIWRTDYKILVLKDTGRFNMIWGRSALYSEAYSGTYKKTIGSVILTIDAPFQTICQKDTLSKGISIQVFVKDTQHSCQALFTVVSKRKKYVYQTDSLGRLYVDKPIDKLMISISKFACFTKKINLLNYYPGTDDFYWYPVKQNNGNVIKIIFDWNEEDKCKGWFFEHKTVLKRGYFQRVINFKDFYYGLYNEKKWGKIQKKWCFEETPFKE